MSRDLRARRIQFKMIEALPEHLRKKLLGEITPIISEALDEAKWEEQFKRSSSKLVSIAESEPSLQLKPDDPFIIQKQKDARR